MAVRFSMGTPTIESRPKKTSQGKGKLERKFKLVYEGRELSSWLSEAGKYDAFQILVQKFDSGVEGAIDPDEVKVIEKGEGE